MPSAIAARSAGLTWPAIVVSTNPIAWVAI
ncbi:glycine dehydrogenase [Vibrio splendidus 12B01]|nr:glycine dehydrogenase [Vibrio splendidus 12B01]